MDLLRRVAFLRGLDDEVLLELAASLPQEKYGPGETIFEQGDRADCLHLLLEGKVSLTRVDTQAEEIGLGQRLPPDALGLLEMVYKQPRSATASAQEATTTLRWDRGLLSTFLKDHASALAGFQFLAQSERLAQQEALTWLRPGEVIYGFARRHVFLLYQRLSLPLLLIAGGLVLLLLSASSGSSLSLAAGAALEVAGILFGAWQFLDWRNDYFIVTDRRAVWIEKVVGIYDSRREAPLHTILSVSVNSDLSGRTFGFGDVIIRTYTGKLIFREIGLPDTVAALIEELLRRMQAMKDLADRDSLVDALQQRMEPPAQQPDAPAVLPAGTEQPDGEEGDSQSNHWGFQVRFEAGGVITYRKHWAVLLREIAFPSAILIFTVGMLGARLGGLVTILNLGMFVGLGALIAGAVGLWWLYRYIDWANDIYQITKDQILDIYKKPLGREERKVAPIENILGTEVDRRGILGLLLNYGDVIANVGTSQFLFEGVLDPVQVQQDIAHAQEALLERRDADMRRRRQNEMVELIDIYHDRFSGREPEGLHPESNTSDDDT